MSTVEDHEDTTYTWILRAGCRELHYPGRRRTRFDYDAAGRRTTLLHANGVRGTGAMTTRLR